jgi:NitT/TauT family transport system substrate-binding protein
LVGRRSGRVGKATMKISSKRTALIGALCAIVAIGIALYVLVFTPRTANELNLRLQWTVQAQFAGYIVADRVGYYSDEGLKVNIRPAGPDLKPLTTVAAGTDDIGIGVSNQAALARSNDVPVKIIAQIFQDSANRYVLLTKNKINDLTQLREKKIGLWLGGDEAEFVAMLATAGMKMSDVQVIPQGFSVAPFLNGDYVLSEVTVYNELLEIEDAIRGKDTLQILAPGDYNSAIVSDMIVVTEKSIQTRRDQLIRFLRASLRGWRYALENRERAVELVVAANPELKRDEQRKQLDAVAELILKGTPLQDIGAMKVKDYETMIRILQVSGQLTTKVNPADVYDDSLRSAAMSP